MSTQTLAQQSQARFEKAKRESAGWDQSDKSRHGARVAQEEKHKRDREEARQNPRPVPDDAAAAPAPPCFSDRLKFSEDGANVRQPSLTAPGYSSGYSAGYAAGLAAAAAGASQSGSWGFARPEPEGGCQLPPPGADAGRPVAAAPSASKPSAPARSGAGGSQKFKAVARTVMGARRMERLVGFAQVHAWAPPRFAQQEEAQVTREALVEEELCSPLERDQHRHSQPSPWALDAAAVAMQKAARGRHGRKAMARKQDERGVLRVDAGNKGFAVSYSYASFEGGAWRGEGAFEAATCTAQYASPTRHFGEREARLDEGAFSLHGAVLALRESRASQPDGPQIGRAHV